MSGPRSNEADWIVPDWPAPVRVRALSTTRSGGVSRAHFASMNLALHVGDDPQDVAENRRRLQKRIGVPVAWLEQVHGREVTEADPAATPVADALLTRRAGLACAVMTADCLPVLLCDRAGSVVAAAHAGWRGLAAGVLEATVERMATPPEELLAWIGPAIGPAAFEVGEEVRAAFVGQHAGAEAAFVPGSHTGKWLADLGRLARQRLARLGVEAVYGDASCTHADAGRFYSHRRDGRGGRMATLVWLADADHDQAVRDSAHRFMHY